MAMGPEFSLGDFMKEHAHKSYDVAPRENRYENILPVYQPPIVERYKAIRENYGN